MCSDMEVGEEDDVSDPEYNIMQEDADDDDDEEIRNDKATRVSSMLLLSVSVLTSIHFLNSPGLAIAGTVFYAVWMSLLSTTNTTLIYIRIWYNLFWLYLKKK